MPIIDKTNKKEVQRYENFVSSSKYGHEMQSTSWAKIKSDNWKSEYVYIEEKGKIIAGITVLVRKIFTGFTIMYAPRRTSCRHI